MSCQTLALLSLVALLLIACGDEATPASDAEPAATVSSAIDKPTQSDTSQESFVIGALDSLTGVGESYGIPFSQSKLIAVEEINAAGGINGRPLKLIIEDSKCTSADAIVAYQRLTDVEGVKIILGATCSGATLGVAPLAEQEGVVLFSASSTSPDISDAGDYIFRTAINSLKVGADIGNTVWADGARTIATITEATDYAEGARRSAVTQFERLGGVVVAAESYPTEAIDFRTQLTKLLNAHPDAVLVAAQGEVSGGTIIKQLREVGYEGPIYSEVVPTGANSLDIAGEAATGLKAVVPNPDLETDIGRDFLASFNARYGIAPWPWFQGSAYDGVYIAAECLRQTNDDQDADGFRDCLYNLTWSGAIGDDYSFDDKGDVVGVSHVVIEVLPVAERTAENLGFRVLGPPETSSRKTYDAYPPMDLPEGQIWVTIATSLGDMTFELFPEEAPLAVNNFVFLAKARFFEGLTFHRLLPGFIAQGGDPTETGVGGPGYSFEIEPPHRPYIRGGLAMSNKGTPDTNGSQFFIVLDDLTTQGRLAPNYTLFGQLKENHQPSLDTLAKIEAVPVIEEEFGNETSSPQQQITILQVIVGGAV